MSKFEHQVIVDEQGFAVLFYDVECRSIAITVKTGKQDFKSFLNIEIHTFEDIIFGTWGAIPKYRFPCFNFSRANIEQFFSSPFEFVFVVNLQV